MQSDRQTTVRLSLCTPLALLALAVLAPASAWAIGGPDTAEFGIDESKRGNQIPLDLSFVDENGHAVRLGQYIDGTKPVILNLQYFGCTKMCGELLNALTEAMRDVKGRIGTDYTVLTVSIDPSEGPKMAHGKKQTYVEWLHQPGAENGWHFLTGQKPQIDALCQSAGWNYKETVVNGQIEFMHGAAIVLLTPEGKVARYMRGTNFQPATLWLSLLEAGEGKVSASLFEHLTLYCYHYDPTTGTYSAQAFRIMQIGGALTVLLLAVVMGGFWLREMRRSTPEPAAGGATAAAASSAAADTTSPSSPPAHASAATDSAREADGATASAHDEATGISKEPQS